MNCNTCGIDVERTKRALTDAWAVNRQRATRALANHLEHGGDVSAGDAGEITAMLIAVGISRRREAPWVEPLLPYRVDGIEIPQN